MKRIVYIIICLFTLIVSGCVTSDGSYYNPDTGLGSSNETPIYVLTSTYSTVNITVPHSDSHANNGSDELNVSGLSGLLADGQTPTTHISTHADNGSDELNVIGLSGLLADGQTPLNHSGSHTENGSDILNVNGLTGRLSDNQPVSDADVIAGISANNIYPSGIGAHNLLGDLSTNGQGIDLGSGSVWTTSTGNQEGIFVKADQNNAKGGRFLIWHDSDSPAVDDTIGIFGFNGENSVGSTRVYGNMLVQIADETAGTEDGRFVWELQRDGVNSVEVMRLDSTGNLTVDAGFAVFDKYDDAILLRDAISKGEMYKLVQAGIATEKYEYSDNFTGTKEYMISIQGISRLNSGGVYQNRERMDSNINALLEMIMTLQNQVLELQNQINELENRK